MKLKIYLAGCFFALSTSVFSKDYTITSAGELAALKLQAGDNVILKNGEWKDQQLFFKGTGTQEKPCQNCQTLIPQVSYLKSVLR